MTEKTGSAGAWPAPPRKAKPDGSARRVGVEIEFAAIPVQSAADAICETLGGEVRYDTPHHATVSGTRLGEFGVEVDTRFAKQAIENEQLAAVRDKLIEIAQAVVPVEIVGPPLAWSDSAPLDDLVASLRRRGAEGTREGLLYAFGVQLNIEPPDMRVETLVATLQAFCLLRDWLRLEIEVDGLRRLAAFESPYPSSYCARILRADYAPDETGLIDDYLRFNPARDRELDCLPILATLDEARTRRGAPDQKINARPAWHYRLPNADFSDPQWSIGLEWSRWLRIERLAEDHELRARWAAEWIENHDRVFPQDWTPRSRELASRLA